MIKATADFTDLMREALTVRPNHQPERRRTLDSTTTEEGPSLYKAGHYALANIRVSAMAAVQQWAETDDLDEGENHADRLMALMVGIADVNKDGEITEDEQSVIKIALEAAWDYLEQCGADEEDVSAILNDWEADAADRVRELVASALPEGEDQARAEIDRLVFVDGDQVPVFDAVYKLKMAIRDGKKVRVKTRVSGSVRLSGKQKLAIRRMQAKSHSATANAHRLKSLGLHTKMGL